MFFRLLAISAPAIFDELRDFADELRDSGYKLLSFSLLFMKNAPPNVFGRACTVDQNLLSSTFRPGSVWEINFGFEIQ